MRKFLIYILVLIVLVVGCLYIFADVLLEIATQKALDFFTRYIKIKNLEYTRPVFEDVKLTSYNSVTWYKLSMEASLVRNDFTKEVDRFPAKMDSFTISLEDILRRNIIVKIKGFGAYRKEKGGKYYSNELNAVPDGIKGADMKFPVNIGAMTPREFIDQLRNLSSDLKTFSQIGVTKIPIQFSAEETFTVRGKPYAIRVSVVKDKDGYRLIADEHGVQHVANTLEGIKATKGDIEFIAYNPIRAPELLRIRNNASFAADTMAKNDPTYPSDAYRHVYWSYLLTKEYGEDFATDATDAHESEADIEERKYAGVKTFEAASYMDFVNGDVGRRYAVLGYDEASLRYRVLNDPEIIRDSEVMTRFDPADYRRRKDQSKWLNASHLPK